MNDIAIEEAVVRTLTYFSLFHYPLTTEELFAYLWQSPGISYSEFRTWLGAHHSSAYATHDGFYFLPGNVGDIAIRMRSAAPTEQKIRRALWGMKCIGWIPFLRGVYLCNSVAAGTATVESDIDIFIVTANSRTWLVRLLITIALSALGIRRHGNKITDRLCLSFYSDINHLDMRSVSLGANDIYLAYWIVQLLPVYDPNNLQGEIVQKNAWMHSLVPNAVNSKKPENQKAKKQILKNTIEKILDKKLGDSVERVAKSFQLKHIHKTSSGRTRPVSSAVVIEDGFLKFHETDRRAEFSNSWQSLCN